MFVHASSPLCILEGFRTFLHPFMSSAMVFVRYKLRVHVAVAIVIQITEDLLWQAT